jgi:D-sedoheptulose 7-phosphate isomerase
MKGYPTYASSAEYLAKVNELLSGLASVSDEMTDALFSAFERGSTIFMAGNGGSASAASHFAQDLAKGTLADLTASRRFRIMPLTDNVGYITALANDEGYEYIFEHQMRAFASEGDVFLAISGSGNSPNIIRAANYAHETGMSVIGVTGFDGGKLRELADVKVHVPIEDMGMCEGIHSVIFHLAMAELRNRVTRANAA